jgi:LmbE family N-acetylglucosaminyl deacetylase
LSAASRILSVSPHPDDELLGAGATLMALRDAGFTVVNLACGLGRPADHARRRAELTEACRLAGFELVIPDRLPAIGAGEDLELAQRALTDTIASALERFEPSLIVGPSPHDGHHGHELVGRALRDAVERRGSLARVMLWGLWGELPFPNVFVPFDSERLDQLQRALAAHAGELARNRFDRLLAGRATANAVLGAERVFGFGSARFGRDYAELLTLLHWAPDTGWRLAAPHVFDPATSLPDGGRQLDWWMHGPSPRASLDERG